ncbi:phosphatidylinositol-4-phosphate 5-kinase [Encephalitozoon hellem]|nr:phosphatidylinositol-4-phosphate 5-kinase [Encephalitozoon hellem]
MEDQRINLMLESLYQIEDMMASKATSSNIEEVRGAVAVVKAYNYREFREIRTLSGIEGLNNLGRQYVLNKQIHGKSGSFLFFTKDLKFIVKTIRKNEFYCIRRMIEEYKTYILQNPMSFLCRILGCYSICTGDGEEYFIVMESMMKGFGMQEIYDLKGMSVNRKGHSISSLKEMDWIENSKRIDLKGKKEVVISQIKNDVQFLKRHRIMDYSFFVSFGTEGEERLGSFSLSKDHGRTSENECVYFGIVDILTQWTFPKRMERLLHILCCKSNSSCLNPDAYMDRFLTMIETDIFK